MEGFLALIGVVAGMTSAWLAWAQHKREQDRHPQQGPTRTRTAGSRAFTVISVICILFTLFILFALFSA